MAKAIKTPKQPKEPVRVRYKTLSDGSQSVYLDIYRDGKRQYEFLKLYLIRRRMRQPRRRIRLRLLRLTP